MADPVGIALALSANTLDETPTWTRIDTTYAVQGWRIDRGRTGELDRTGTGTATIDLIDSTGDFDPTATPLAELMMQAAICLLNPTNDTWSTVFRGFVDRIEWVPYVSQSHANVRLYLVDGMALLASAEMTPDGTYGDSVVDGNIVFAAGTGTDAVQERIGDGTSYGGVLGQYGWASGLRSVFTGNVKLLERTYAPRTPVLVVIQDAADAEFPGVANFFFDREGNATFHGRLARFDPTNPDYEITTWECGDRAAVAASPSTVVPVSPPLIPYKSSADIITSAIATHRTIDDADISGQLYEDPTAIGLYGYCTWSAENLETAGGAATTALVETKKFATYYVDNYKDPKTRVGSLVVRPQDPAGVSGDVVWALMGAVDISDRVLLTTSHVGSGGFNDHFFVEGVHYEALPMSADQLEVTLTLDVSPASFYDSNPF